MGKRNRRRERQAQIALGVRGTGDRHGPLGEMWGLDGPIAALVHLQAADTPEGLQRALLVPGRRRDTLPDEAVDAFTRAHAHDRATAPASALLLCGHRRFTGIARRILDGVAAAGLLDDTALDALADCYLSAEDPAVTVPGGWVVDWYVQHREGELRRLDPAKTYTIRLPVAPQLRRWAATRVARDAAGAAEVLRRAEALDSRHGDAAVLGLLDACDELDEQTAAVVLDRTVEWRSATVRLPALQRLAAAGDHAQALRRAQRDAAAHVRRWASQHRQPALVSGRGVPTDAAVGRGVPTHGAAGTERAVSADRAAPAQAQLF